VNPYSRCFETKSNVITLCFIKEKYLEKIAWFQIKISHILASRNHINIRILFISIEDVESERCNRATKPNDSHVRRYLFPGAQRHWISDKTFAFNFSVLLGKRPTKLITGKFSETRTSDRLEREIELGARMLSLLHNRNCDFTSKFRLSKYRTSGLSSLLDKLQNCRPVYRI